MGRGWFARLVHSSILKSPLITEILKVPMLKIWKFSQLEKLIRYVCKCDLWPYNLYYFILKQAVTSPKINIEQLWKDYNSFEQVNIKHVHVCILHAQRWNITCILHVQQWNITCTWTQKYYNFCTVIIHINEIH